jgi:pyruvate formate lyase activating enzyme
LTAEKSVRGTVLSIERCSLHDGPGLRTTVFLKGCPLFCIWCHNPESQSFKPEIYFFEEKCSLCGTCEKVCASHNVNEIEHFINRAECCACDRCLTACPQSAMEIKGTGMAALDVINIALKDERYYKKSGGGLTLSGGEPLAQFDFSLEILRLAKEKSVNTCLETSGYAPEEKFLSILQYVDFLLYDFKESSEDEHKKATGVSHNLIMENLSAADKAGAKIILRCPVIPAFNERDDHFSAIAAAANAHKNIIEINLMPYHPMGISKAERIGCIPRLSDLNFPTEEQIEGWIQKVSRETDVKVKKG